MSHIVPFKADSLMAGRKLGAAEAGGGAWDEACDDGAGGGGLELDASRLLFTGGQAF